MAVRRFPASVPAEGVGGIGYLIRNIFSACGGQTVHKLAAEVSKLH
jgi:hypothetical protein